MIVIGTAGHIDHGKSSLVTALTGMHPDRLEEEQRRGMTIDLGFAWMTLPSGKEVGFVDVPGHHKFVKNMLAGTGSIDGALLVVAADDGWMPQTQEHCDIIEILGVTNNIIVITKIDLVDHDWLTLVQDDIAERVQGTVFANSPVIAVSCSTKENINQLVEEISEQVERSDHKVDIDNPILWIDRVFSIKGSGTVVTGTLLDGKFSVGDVVLCQPQGISAKIRGMETHKKPLTTAVPGSRLALNLSNIDASALKRGAYLCKNGMRKPYSLINTSISLLDSSPQIKNGQTLKLHIGSLETLATIKLMQKPYLTATETDFAQLELEEPAHFPFGARFCLRHPEHDQTIGGGQFLEEGLPYRGKALRIVGPKRSVVSFKFIETTSVVNLPLLERKQKWLTAGGTDQDILALLSAERSYWEKNEFWNYVGNSALLGNTEGIVTAGDFILSTENWNSLLKGVEAAVTRYHSQNRLSPGLPKETLRSTLEIPNRLLDEALKKHPSIQEWQGVIRHNDFELALSPQEEQLWEKLRDALKQNPYQPPNLGELAQEGYREEFVFGLIQLKRLVLLANQQVTTVDILGDVRSKLAEIPEGFTLGEFRDLFSTSRKHALAFLEHLDQIRVTKRIGDKRIIV